MIVVTGATGTVGSELVRLLADGGRKVRALSRDPWDQPARSGVEWVRADLAEREGLDAAFRGGKSLFLLTGNSDDMVRLQTNAIRAAVSVGVESVVKLSALGATDHSRSVIGLWHYNVERVLRETAAGWTILRPHHFMQNLLEPLVFDRERGRVHASSGDGPIPFIDTRDIAAVAATVLSQGGHGGRVYTLTGPQAVSYREATAILAEVLDRPLTYADETTDEAWARRRAAGQPVWLAAAQLAIAEYQRAGGPTARTSDTVEAITGRPPRTLGDFARDHAAELAS